jgi:hypothetical protein
VKSEKRGDLWAKGSGGLFRDQTAVCGVGEGGEGTREQFSFSDYQSGANLAKRVFLQQISVVFPAQKY